eukprot:3562472-Amphidinium_carterae.1
MLPGKLVCTKTTVSCTVSPTPSGMSCATWSAWLEPLQAAVWKLPPFQAYAVANQSMTQRMELGVTTGCGAHGRSPALLTMWCCCYQTRAWVAGWNCVPPPRVGDDALTGDIFMDGAAINSKSALLRCAGWSNRAK